MNYGPNARLVEEVFSTLTPDFLLRGVVRGEIPIEAEWFEFTEVLREAARVARTQDLWEEGFDDWCSLTEIAIARFMYPVNPVVDNYQYTCRELQKVGQRIGRSFAGAVAASSEKHEKWTESMRFIVMTDLIERDIGWIAIARMQYGFGYEPFESMFSAYKQGGWPCGWRGDYPLGKMVVYHVGPKL